jgi:glutamyl-tRNA(Gln) amidotransferase subunit E
LGAALDPTEIQLKVGLEIHQQLASSTKLFCSCPITKTEEFPYVFERRLRPAQGELGEVDRAAIFEFSRGRSNVYSWSPESSCLVDADEEPPHPMSRETVETALTVSLMLDSHVMDEIHMMRKIVIDGSNTSGFQRTAVVAMGGMVESGSTRVGVQSISLEEDAARILGEDEGSRYFALDRLGVPLVEIALEPVTGPPELVADVALALGRTLRSTGRVARGLGTIRQDLNVSVMGGPVVEVKGVQKLNLLAKVVSYEAARQMGLRAVAQRVKEGGKEVRCTCLDVSGVLSKTSSRVLRRQLEGGSRIVCVAASGLAGLMGWEPHPGVRLGREVAEVARMSGLGGVVHSDEFAKQGVSSDEESRLRKEMGCGKDAALVLVAGKEGGVEKAAAAVAARLEAAPAGVLSETRAATEDGETRYLRPKPGSQRMYPETDIPDFVVNAKLLRPLKERLPATWQDTVRKLELESGLSRDAAFRLYDSGYTGVFQEVAKRLDLEPSFIASTLVELPVRLSREGIDPGTLGDAVLIQALEAIDGRRVAKEAAPEILRLVGKGEAEGIDDAIAKLGLTALSEKDVEELVDRVIRAQSALAREKGEGAFSALMGEVMKEARGRADGGLVGRLLRQKLKRART